MNEENCYYYKGVFIPECMGGVISGPYGCTCQPIMKPDPLATAQARILELEKALGEAAEKAAFAHQNIIHTQEFPSKCGFCIDVARFRAIAVHKEN